MTTKTAAAASAAPAKGGLRGACPPLVRYSGPLWKATANAFCGRDDATGRVVCDCPSFRRGSMCRHVESVLKCPRPDAIHEQLDHGFDWVRVLFGATYDHSGPEPRRVGGYAVTLRRVEEPEAHILAAA